MTNFIKSKILFPVMSDGKHSEQHPSLIMESTDPSYRYYPECRNAGRVETGKVGIDGGQMGILLSYIAQEYILRNSTEIERLLQQRSGLVPLLQEIPTKIHEYFGPKTKIALCTFKDPENPSDISLTVLIQSSMGVEETLRRMDAFDEGWWLAASLAVDSAISVNTEYV
jgi:hypothetical protein